MVWCRSRQRGVGVVGVRGCLLALRDAGWLRRSSRAADHRWLDLVGRLLLKRAEPPTSSQQQHICSTRPAAQAFCLAPNKHERHRLVQFDALSCPIFRISAIGWISINSILDRPTQSPDAQKHTHSR